MYDATLEPPVDNSDIEWAYCSDCGETNAVDDDTCCICGSAQIEPVED